MTNKSPTPTRDAGPATAGFDLSSGPGHSAVTLINPSQASLDVLTERQRQLTDEGWTPEHDDQHNDGEIAGAAATYALSAADYIASVPFHRTWPWQNHWWKPTTPRRDLVKAGALILAEIERLDRLAAHQARRAGE